MTTNGAQELVNSVRALLATGAYGSRGEAGDANLDAWNDVRQREFAVQVYEATAGSPCPPGFAPTLLLPDELTLSWHDGEIAGEINLVNPQLALEQPLDESLHKKKVDDILLGSLRVFDRVVENAGPFYICWKPDDTIPGQLYLFNLHSLNPIDLNAEEYCAAAGHTLGLIFWQHLFVDGKLTRDKAASLEAGLTWLHGKAPSQQLAAFRRRLTDRE